MKFMVIGCLCAGALAGVGCADGLAVPTSPSASAAVSSLAETAAAHEGTTRPAVSPSLSASPRSGDIHVTKVCGPGPVCTITASNVKAVEVGSKIHYLQPDQLFTPSGSDVVLNPPGPGNNTAFGHCSLSLGVCTFSGGTGKFTWFHGSVAVSQSPDSLWHWEGTYSFTPRD